MSSRSVRPDDGRYGENPNRMQYYFQYQVILKPDPGNPQEIYLKSLEALGINPREHDIRFVEDNWESPALGAWGLGWEVWMDGQEITQFTYFQQAGGIELEPVSVEITYGLERIALAAQGKDSVWEIDWLHGRELWRHLPAKRDRTLPLLLRNRGCGRLEAGLRRVSQRKPTGAGGGGGHPGLRLRAEVQPFVQCAGCTRGDWCDGAGGVLPRDAGYDAKCRQSLCRPAGTA